MTARSAMWLAAAFLAGCGGRQAGSKDYCARALAEGPPTLPVTCPAGTERATRIERSGARFIPTPSGRGRPLSEVATVTWCADSAGASQGPFVATNARRQVIRSGQFTNDEPNGTWVAWDRQGRPAAITHFENGKLEGEARCQ